MTLDDGTREGVQGVHLQGSTTALPCNLLLLRQKLDHGLFGNANGLQ